MINVKQEGSLDREQKDHYETTVELKSSKIGEYFSELNIQNQIKSTNNNIKSLKQSVAERFKQKNKEEQTLKTTKNVMHLDPLLRIPPLFKLSRNGSLFCLTGARATDSSPLKYNFNHL